MTTKRQTLLLVVLVTIMLAVATQLGNWAESINPDGIAPHPVAEGEKPVENLQQTSTEPRNAYWFGVSIGLLGTSLLYCCLAMGLLIQGRTSAEKSANKMVYWIGGLAALGFVLSYLVDDYFY